MHPPVSGVCPLRRRSLPWQSISPAIRITASSATSCTLSSAAFTRRGDTSTNRRSRRFWRAGSQLFGHSLFLLRLICAVFAAASVYTTCLLAAELGGGAFAQFFAALIAALTPVLMDFGTKLSADIVGLWLWPLAALYVLRIVKGADPRWWLLVGTIVGICVESKYTVIFFAISIVFGLLLLPQRRVLFTAWFAGGVLIAALIGLPNFLWQAAHGFPMWTLLRAAAQYKDVPLTPPQFLVTQLLITYPLLAPVWLIGLATLLRRWDVRFLGIAYLALILQMIVLHAKHYYAGDVYPIPIAAGAVTIEAWTARATRWRPVLALYALIVGIALVPLLMPVLPERTMSAYDRVLQTMLSARSESCRHRTHADRQLASRLGRHARLARAGTSRRTRVRLATPGRTRTSRNPCEQLRRGRRPGFLWSRVRPAARAIGP